MLVLLVTAPPSTYGLGFGIEGLGFEFWDCGMWGLGFGAWSSDFGFKVSGSGFCVLRFGSRFFFKLITSFLGFRVYNLACRF